MKQSTSIQLKAALLLVIFGLNTVVGFACSIGIRMGFNTGHYHEEATEVHIHANGKTHYHEKSGHKHSHKDTKDDCCNDKVLKISQTDKVIPQTAKLISPVFLTAFFSAYCNINISYSPQANISNKYFLR